MNMFHISNISTSNTKDSIYVKPFSVNYIQNGVKKTWDLIETHHSVSVVIYNITRKVLVFVKQFRPGVYINSIPVEDRKGAIDTTKYPSSLGVTIELCSGIVDKQKTLAEIARDEILEECGYDVPLENLEQIKTYRSAVGVSGDQQTLFYAEVTDSMKTHNGGGLTEECEFIEVVEMTVPEVMKYLEEDTVNSPGGFIGALLWFFVCKSKK